LDGTDAVFLSGGVPADLPFIEEARDRGIRILNDSQLFLENVHVPVLGITGSSGKSTTTSLTGHILSRHLASVGRRVWVGGNLGNPLISDLGRIEDGDLVVMELSSFQLEVMDRSPQIAALLNVTPNHLDRHGTMERYLAAKARILQFQDSSDWAVLGWDDPLVRRLEADVKGKLAGFGRTLNGTDGIFFDDHAFRLRWGGRETQICSLEESPLRGSHNHWNIAAAFALCRIHGVEPEEMVSALRDFRGLPHRLEELGSRRGLVWINDSIATTPERAAAALRSFTEPVVVLAGGHDKGLSWSPFASAAEAHVQKIILFGEAAGTIMEALKQEGCRIPVCMTENLESAVRTAADTAEKDSVVLLSPGCSSFDAYLDFEARGEHFREMVETL
jgi:UDP-N-acetylmuramoylalanine--D-glutamate ligase